MKLAIINIIITCIFIFTINDCVKASTSDYIYPSNSFSRSPNVEVVFSENICKGQQGNASLTITGGVGPYVYEWSTGEISPSITYNYGGIFWVKVTDLSDNTSTTKTFTVVEHPGLEVSIVSKDVSCFDLEDGKAEANVSNGTSPFQYLWSTTQTTKEISSLVAGSYSVAVTDLYGCQGEAVVEILRPEKLSLKLTPPQGICKGNSIELFGQVDGGTKPYTYLWGDDPSINVSYRVVSPEETSSYSLSVTDGNGCQLPAEDITISVSQPIVISSEISPIKCNGASDGEVTLNISGGTAPFSYSWESPTNSMAKLSPGIYNVTVTDRFDCKNEIVFTMAEPEMMVVQAIVEKPTCYNFSNGSASLKVSGGVPFTNDAGEEYYNYIWSTGDNGAIFTGMAGDYEVTVTDMLGCSHILNVKIKDQNPIYTTDPKDGTICKGETYITSSQASGGVAPYKFVWSSSTDASWNNFGEILTVSPVETTIYTLQVSDAKGCYAPAKTVTVSVNPPIKIKDFKFEPKEICAGDTVSIYAEFEGGNGGPYFVKFDNVESITLPYKFTPTVSGKHSIKVSDACDSPTDLKEFAIKVFPSPNLLFHSEETSSCIPGTFQFIESSPEANRSFAWDFGDNNISTERNPYHTYTEAGHYTISLTATSDFGCTRTITYDDYIEIYPSPVADFISEPISASILDPQVKFYNQSEGASNFFINYGDDNSSIWEGDVIIHFYDTPGKYMVGLIAETEYGCADTTQKPITIYEETTFYAPTAFTPNGDGINDLFFISGTGIQKEGFLLRVYDRSGSIVFESTEYDSENIGKMSWNGTSNSVGYGSEILSNGVYTWHCQYKDHKGKAHSKSGSISLIK